MKASSRNPRQRTVNETMLTLSFVIILSSLLLMTVYLHLNLSRNLNLNNGYLKERAVADDYIIASSSRLKAGPHDESKSNVYSTHAFSDVLKIDVDVLANIRNTYQGARSFTEWALDAKNVAQFQTIPLQATVDKRPIIVRKQLAEDGRKWQKLADNGKLLGCALTGAVFVSDLHLLELHPQLVSSLFHLIRNSPGSTHIVAVVDGQAQRSFKEIQTLLKTNINDLFGNRVFGDVRSFDDQELIPLSSMKPTNISSQTPLTLLELLRIRRINILIVPVITPPLVVEKTVCAGQYSFAPFLAARYAADYHVIMYVDGDTAMIEGNNNKQTLNEMMWHRFFGKKSSTKCAGHRMRLIEQYVNPENYNNEALLQCTQHVALDKQKWEYALANCNLKEGHIVARTDSVYAFSVHHPDTLSDYLPAGVNDCIVPEKDLSDPYLLDEDEFVQLHLRNRQRKAECACVFEPS